MTTKTPPPPVIARRDLASDLHARTGIAAADCLAVLDAFLAAIPARLAAGERVRLHGFGAFEAVERPTRMARDPRTGARIVVPARTRARFRAAKALHDACRG